ncbi:MAG: hypothetical protein LAT61_00055 [Alcanivorax sp.]|nr:hypothetical protein [Alcanivorax sp.]
MHRIGLLFRRRKKPADEPLSETPARPPRGEQSVAHPGTAAPPEHHHGRRAVKEWFTNHWDMDYMSREELENLEQAMREREKKESKNQ